MTPRAYRNLIGPILANTSDGALSAFLDVLERHPDLVIRGEWGDDDSHEACVLTHLARNHETFAEVTDPGLALAMWLGSKAVADFVRAWDAELISVEELKDIIRNELFLRSYRGPEGASDAPIEQPREAAPARFQPITTHTPEGATNVCS